MADLDLDHLEALDREGTPGPWRAEWRPALRNYLIRCGDADEDGMAHHEQPNARLIAATRNALPALIAEARAAAELRRRIALLRVCGEGCRDAGDAILEVLDAAEARLSEMEAAMQAVDGVTDAG